MTRPACLNGSASRTGTDGDSLMGGLLTVVAGTAVLAILLILVFIGGNALDALVDIGPLEFVFGTEWDPADGVYGALPVITGTVLVTAGAMAIALPLGIGCAIFISEVASPRQRNLLKPVCEVFAGIPSVVYGFFGLLVLVPFLRETFPDQLLYGSSWLAGSILLGIMALPTVISVSEDAIHAVPSSYREASLAMGASRWETTVRVVVPAALSGISAAAILGVGRAIGETMAVMMVTGNSPMIPEPLWNIFSLVTTITGTIASEMPEIVVGDLHYSSLFLLALVLMGMVLSVNLVARTIVRRAGCTAPRTHGALSGPLFRRLEGMGMVRALSEHRGTVCRVVGSALLFTAVMMFGSLVTGPVVSAFAGSVLVLVANAYSSLGRGLGSNRVQSLAHGSLALVMGLVILMLVVILGHVLVNGLPALSSGFLTGDVADGGRSGGIFPAIVGTLQLIAGTVVIALPLGIASGVYLAEYSGDNTATRIIREAIDILNGTPSIVFGLFGFSFLVVTADLGYSMVAGWITLSVMVLPVVIRTTEEALGTVPRELREASRAMGATKWQTTYRVVLPAAMGGVMTGSILALGRAAGETAPIMFTAAVAFSTHMADSIMDPVMALPYHLYYLATEVPGSTEMQYGTACVLLLIVLSMFLVASAIRYRTNKKIRW